MIIPLTEFIQHNGSTQLQMDGTIYHFISEPFKALIMNGSTIHRQSANTTNYNRDVLTLQIDSGAF